MDTTETNATEIKWVVCSTKFVDIIHIAPKELNTIPVEPNYEETWLENIQRAYFNYARST